MQFTYRNSWVEYESGVVEPTKTIVSLDILSNDGHTGYVNICLKGDHRGKSHEELVKLADDEFFSKKYSARALDEKYTELERRIDELKEMQKIQTLMFNAFMEPSDEEDEDETEDDVEESEDETEEDEANDRNSNEHSEKDNGGAENA